MWGWKINFASSEVVCEEYGMALYLTGQWVPIGDALQENLLGTQISFVLYIYFDE